MILPRCSQRQWIVSAVLISIGLGIILLSDLAWALAALPPDGPLASLAGPAQVFVNCLGWTLICAGSVSLYATRYRTAFLLLAVSASLAGWATGGSWTGAAVGLTLVLAAAAIAESISQG